MTRAEKLKILDGLGEFHTAGVAVTASAEGFDELVAQGRSGDLDPRGVLWIWEPPKSNALYKMGLDPTVGVTGWTRASRLDGDDRVDNAALVVVRVDAFRVALTLPDGSPDIDPVTKRQRERSVDLQVAEYAAPVDATEAARIANALGRIYRGVDEEACELIHESWPGPGMLTTQELLRLGYPNIWHWERFANVVVEETQNFGWHSSFESQKTLWYRSRIHMMERRAKVQSPWLKAEYADAVIHQVKQRATVEPPGHDDRMQAWHMALWAAHEWTQAPEPSHEEVLTGAETVDWQRRAPVFGEETSWRESFARAMDGWE